MQLGDDPADRAAGQHLRRLDRLLQLSVALGHRQQYEAG